MGKSEMIRYDFNKSAAEVIRDASLKKGYAEMDLALLKGYDEKIDEDFLATLDAKIEYATLLSPDYAALAIQSGIGKLVKEKRVDCENFVGDIRYFAKKVFPKLTGVRNEFGFNDYLKAKTKPAEFVLFMRKLHDVVNKYGTQLTDRGMPAALLARGAELATELEQGLLEHGEKKRGRGNLTQERRLVHNEVWAMHRLICEAGKAVFRNNYARYQYYILYENNNKPPSIKKKFKKLLPLKTAKAFSQFKPDTVLLFKNPGIVDLRFFRNKVAKEPNGEEGFVLEARSEIVKPAKDVPGEGPFINVTNLSETDSGLYLVQKAE